MKDKKMNKYDTILERYTSQTFPEPLWVGDYVISGNDKFAILFPKSKCEEGYKVGCKELTAFFEKIIKSSNPEVKLPTRTLSEILESLDEQDRYGKGAKALVYGTPYLIKNLDEVLSIAEEIGDNFIFFEIEKTTIPVCVKLGAAYIFIGGLISELEEMVLIIK